MSIFYFLLHYYCSFLTHPVSHFQAILVHHKCSSIHQYWAVPVSGTWSILFLIIEFSINLQTIFWKWTLSSTSIWTSKSFSFCRPSDPNLIFRLANLKKNKQTNKQIGKKTSQQANWLVSTYTFWKNIESCNLQTIIMMCRRYIFGMSENPFFISNFTKNADFLSKWQKVRSKKEMERLKKLSL